MKEKRLRDQLQWIPLHQRLGRFGFPLSQKVDSRKPVYWKTSVFTKQARELYFVNDSEETLDFVKAEDGGFFTEDDVPVSMWTREGKGYVYPEVRKREAVKVAEFDDYYDLDYMLTVAITVISPSQGILGFSLPLKKGGVKECVLLYDSGEVGKGCAMSRE